MKNSKISKILGVGLTIAMLTSLLAIATPASAGTLSWSEESTDKLSADATLNQLVSGSDVNRIAVEGSTIYAISSAATANLTFKSTNGGKSWTRLTITGLAVPALVAVAPGAPDTLVVTGDGTEVYLSTDGGVTFNLLALSTTPMTAINDVKISSLTAGTRYITLAGTAGGVADIQFLPLGSLVSTWTSVANAGVSADSATWVANGGAALGPANVRAIAFSPNFASDKVLTAVTTNATATNFEVLSFASKKINAAAGFVSYPVALLGAASTSAAISLAPTYLGADETLRTAFVALSSGTTPDGGKLARLDNTSVRDFAAGVDFSSVAFNGTDLVAGAEASNTVYYSANPLAALASVTVSTTTSFQRPGGAGTTMTQVAWAGANVVAGTTGATSAFAVSKDKGATFNDISIFDGATAAVMTNLTDVAVSKDGSIVFLATNDGANTSIWKKTAAWERILTLAGMLDIIIRADTAGNMTNLYLVEKATTNLWHSTDQGEKAWSLKPNLLANAADVAVESAQVLYAVSAVGRVSKTTNAGFTWDAEVATGLATGATITSVAKDQILVGGTDGTIAWSTDGNASSTTWVSKTGAALPTTGWGAGPVHLTADKLSAGGFIYAAIDSADKNVIRWTVGTSTSFSDIITLTITGNAKGIALNDGVLYVLSFSATDNLTRFTRQLKPSTAGSSSPTGDWSTPVTTANRYTSMPKALVVGGTGKFWAIKVPVPAATNTLDSFTDTTYKTPVVPTAPADLAVPTTNPVTGRAQDLAFSWPRLGSLISANGYQIEIALDSAFNQVIFTANPTLGSLPATTANPVVIIIGPDQPAGRNYPFAPGTTYYWRVKAVTPLESPVSATRNFTFSALVAPFAIQGPAVGATDVPIKPILSWTPYKGALWYELTVSEDPTFAIPEFSHNVGTAPDPITFYGVTETLKYSTTYYWRVRGVTAEPFVKGTKVITPAGPWQTGAFTTMAEPKAAEPTVIVTEKPAPPPQIITVEKPVIVPAAPQAIPNWMLLTIIVIGAVLVIALIVLIVRTRKVA
ncbi:MAG: hypothetical protein HYX80_05950 [Chloroflexi bacterium]|nr:hypothetical protein [Chloroflexota bacterium]